MDHSKQTKIMKLISMRDFVLEQDNKASLGGTYDKIVRYANFLKQPLTLGMFIPCDEKGNVLENPKRKVLELSDGTCGYVTNINAFDKYLQAKERVLFEGFELKDGFIIMSDKQFLDTSKLKNKTVENLINQHYTLTESAIKKLGL